MAGSLLEDICRQLAAIENSKNNLQNVFRNLYEQEIERMSREDIRERASRLHTELRCRTIAGRYRNGKIIVPCQEGEVREGYKFVQRDSRRKAIEVYSLQDNVLKDEIELLMQIEGEYIIVETHLGNHKSGNRGINGRVRKERTEEVIQSCEIYTGKRPSLIIVIRKDLMYLAKREGSAINAFVQRGGGIVPFYTTKEGWQKDVGSLVEKAYVK
jgi:hypothetical protein